MKTHLDGNSLQPSPSEHYKALTTIPLSTFHLQHEVQFAIK